MLTVKTLWDGFVATGFYSDNGLEPGSLWTHDLADHGVSPYKGKYIPISFEGEVLAQINNRARAWTRATILGGQPKQPFAALQLEEFAKGLEEEYPVSASELEQMDIDYLKAWYKECLDFWEVHPLIMELHLL